MLVNLGIYDCVIDTLPTVSSLTLWFFLACAAVRLLVSIYFVISLP